MPFRRSWCAIPGLVQEIRDKNRSASLCLPKRRRLPYIPPRQLRELTRRIAELTEELRGAEIRERFVFGHRIDEWIYDSEEKRIVTCCCSAVLRYSANQVKRDLSLTVH